MGITFSYFIALAYALKFRRKMHDAIPSSIMGISMLLYLSSFAIGIEHSIFVIIFFSIFAIVYVVIRSLSNFQEVLELVKTKASLLLIFSFLLFAICSLGRGLQRGDDLTYWGYNIKYMYLYGKFQKGMIHGPSSILWCYFANKTWIGLSTGISMWAQNILTISILFPLTGEVNSENTSHLKWISSFLITMVFPLEFSDSTYSSLMPDVLLGLLTAYMIYNLIMFLYRDRYYIIDLLLSLYMATLLKRMGIFFASGTVFITAYLIQNRINIKERHHALRFLPILEVIIIDAFYLSWYRISKLTMLFCLIPLVGMIAGYYLKMCIVLYLKHKKWGLFILSETVLILCRFLGQPSTNSHEAYYVNINRWFAKEVFTVDYSSLGDTTISLGQFLLICSVGIFIFRSIKIKRQAYDWQDRMLVCLEGLYILFDIGYLGALFITYREYISDLNGDFGQYLPGLDRYMIPCYIPLILIPFYYLLVKYSKQLVYIAILEATLVILCTDMSRVSEYVLLKYVQPKFYAAQKAGIILTEKDKIYFVDQADDYETTIWGKAFAYDMLPAQCDYKNPMADLRTEEGVTPEEWKSVLSNGYTYVYLQSINNDFKGRYNKLFSDKDEIEDGSIYQVTVKDGQLMLVKCRELKK